MTYSDYIISLNPDHYWSFDNTHDDIGVGPSAPKPTNQLGGNTALLNGPPITKDSVSSLTVASKKQRTECADSSEINNGHQEKRTMGGFFMPSEIAFSPSALYKEGGGSNNIAFLIGFGNKVQLQAVSSSGGFDIQCYSDNVLVSNRTYHLMFELSGTNDNNELALYVDGVRSSDTVPSPPALNNTIMPSHGSDINWGQPDVSLNIGGTKRGFNGAQGYYAHWATWTDLLGPSVIHEIFEKGALPTYTVTNQGDLDALADTVIDNNQLSIYIDVEGDIDLIASNITFHSLTSIDIQYGGTGTCTWTNTNGANASKASAPFGGTISIINPRTIDLEGVVIGSRVFVSYTDTDEVIVNEVATISNLSIPVSYTGDRPVVIKIRKASEAPYYQPYEQRFTQRDQNYEFIIEQILD